MTARNRNPVPTIRQTRCLSQPSGPKHAVANRGKADDEQAKYQERVAVPGRGHHHIARRCGRRQGQDHLNKGHCIGSWRPPLGR